MELEDVDLGSAAMIDDLRRDLDLGEAGGVGGHRGTINEQDCREGQGTARLTGDTVHDDKVANFDLLLTAAGANDRVHLDSFVADNETTSGGSMRRHEAQGTRIRILSTVGQTGSSASSAAPSSEWAAS